jgi:putative selenium metabolism hydrolase
MPESATTEQRALDGLAPRTRKLVKLARDLVRTPSLSGAEHDAARLLARELVALGYRDVEVDDHGNVVGYLGEGPPELMFNGHLDHVAVAGMEDPYEGSLEPGERWGEPGWALRGRGSCDMKANVAAAAFSAAFLDPGTRLVRSVVFTADVQEETDSPAGVRALIERGIRARYGVSVESTGLDVALGHRGKLNFEITVRGRSSHASTPSDGLNAVFAARHFLTALESAATVMPDDDFLGRATITVTHIASEPAADLAVVPSLCVLTVDRRYVRGETPESCLAELRELTARAAAEAGLDAGVELVNHYPLMWTPAEHPLVEATRAAATAALGRQPALRAWRFGVNATFMNESGIPSIGLGPGSEDWAHTPEEHVPIGELIDAARVYGELIRTMCAADGAPPLRPLGVRT